jgi:hypothetical protein
MKRDRSLFWIEPERLAAALERAGVGGGVRGRAARPERALAPPLEPPPPALTPAVPAPRRAEPFAPPAGALAEQLQALADWIARTTGCAEILVADPDGLPMLARAGADELVGLAVSASRFLDQTRERQRLGAGKSLALQLAQGDLLYVFQVHAETGTVCLGLKSAELLSRETVARVEEGLSRLLTPEGGAS